MRKQEQREKRYVPVQVRFDTEGNMRPMVIEFDEAHAYTIDKDEDAKLRNRIETLKGMLIPKQTVHLTMVTTYGVVYGKHSGIVQKEVMMDDLFNG